MASDLDRPEVVHQLAEAICPEAPAPQHVGGAPRVGDVRDLVALALELRANPAVELALYELKSREEEPHGAPNVASAPPENVRCTNQAAPHPERQPVDHAPEPAVHREGEVVACVCRDEAEPLARAGL